MSKSYRKYSKAAGNSESKLAIRGGDAPSLAQAGSERLEPTLSWISQLSCWDSWSNRLPVVGDMRGTFSWPLPPGSQL